MSNRSLLLIAAALALIAAGLAWGTLFWTERQASLAGSAGPGDGPGAAAAGHEASGRPRTVSGAQAPPLRPADRGGDIALTRQDGEQVALSDLPGRYRLIYFGFAWCPDICPTSLFTLTKALARLPEARAAAITPVFVTVDPARDTPEALRDYVAAFHERLVGLTGSREAVDAAAEAFDVYYRLGEPDARGRYTVDHSSFYYLTDRKGHVIAQFPHGQTPASLAEGVARILAER